MNLLTDIWLLLRRKVVESVRQPVWIAMNLSMPLLFLIFFAPLLQPLAGGPGFRRGGVLDVFVPGILMMTAYTSVASNGWFLLTELQTGVIERLRVTPVSRFALLMGSVLRDVLAMIIPALIVLGIAIPFGLHPHWAGIALLMALLALVTAATATASYGLALVLRQVESLSGVTSSVMMPIMLLSGMFLPLSLAPGWMQAVAHFNPLYYAVEGGRDLALGTIWSSTVLLAFGVLGGLTVLAMGWATRTFRRAVA